MNRYFFKFLFIYVTISSIFQPRSIALAEMLSEGVKQADDRSGPIVVTSETFEVDDLKSTVLFYGDVTAIQDDLVIKCNKMAVYYQRRSGQKDLENINANIDKIIATGEVKITQKDNGEATAEQATYYQGDDKIILTGSPIVKKGKNIVEGTTITLFIKENRSIVEGSKDSKAKAVLYPNEK